MLYAVDYNPKTQTLEVVFTKNGVFVYAGVPPAEYKRLMKSDSGYGMNTQRFWPARNSDSRPRMSCACFTASACMPFMRRLRDGAREYHSSPDQQWVQILSRGRPMASSRSSSRW